MRAPRSIGPAAAMVFAAMLHARGKPLPERPRARVAIPKPDAPRAYLGGSRLYAPNGDRECARRARQIAKGSLRRDNGLRLPGSVLP